MKDELEEPHEFRLKLVDWVRGNAWTDDENHDSAPK